MSFSIAPSGSSICFPPTAFTFPPGKCENCGNTFTFNSSSVDSLKFEFFCLPSPAKPSVANCLAFFARFSASSAGVWAATAETPAYADDIAADAKTNGTSPIFVFDSFANVSASSSLSLLLPPPPPPPLKLLCFRTVAGAATPAEGASPPPTLPRSCAIFASWESSIFLWCCSYEPDVFIVLNASCAWTMCDVFCFNWLSKFVRFKHKNGTCKNVLNAFNPKLFNMLVSNTNGRIGLVSENNLATSCSTSSMCKILFDAG